MYINYAYINHFDCSVKYEYGKKTYPDDTWKVYLMIIFLCLFSPLYFDSKQL